MRKNLRGTLLAMLLSVGACAVAETEAIPVDEEKAIALPVQEYEISRSSDGGFATRISGIMINEGSTSTTRKHRIEHPD